MADCCSGKTILIYSCSGAADVGEIADRVARKLNASGYGKMSCIVSVGAELSGYIASAKGADRIISIDGCKTSCGKKILEKIGVDSESWIVTQLGFDKGTTPATEEVVNKIFAEITKDK